MDTHQLHEMGQLLEAQENVLGKAYMEFVADAGQECVVARELRMASTHVSMAVLRVKAQLEARLAKQGEEQACAAY
jgi:hypothetical protein